MIVVVIIWIYRKKQFKMEHRVLYCIASYNMVEIYQIYPVSRQISSKQQYHMPEEYSLHSYHREDLV
jgi:hypothetical protein